MITLTVEMVINYVKLYEYFFAATQIKSSCLITWYFGIFILVEFIYFSRKVWTCVDSLKVQLRSTVCPVQRKFKMLCGRFRLLRVILFFLVPL